MSKKRMANVQSGHHSFFFSVFPKESFFKRFFYSSVPALLHSLTNLLVQKGE